MNNEIIKKKTIREKIDETIRVLKRAKVLLLMSLVLSPLGSFFILAISDFSDYWVGFGSHYWLILGWLCLWTSGLFVYLGIVSLLAGEEIDSHGEAFRKLEKMLNSATKNIKIITGNMDSKAYVEDEGVMEALKRKIREGVNIKIICGHEIDPKTEKEFSLLLNQYPNFSIIQIKEKNPYPHGMLVDDYASRIEEHHHIGELLRSNSCFKGNTTINDFFKDSFDDYEREAMALRNSGLNKKESITKPQFNLRTN